MNNENMSSGKGLTLVKTTLLPGQEWVTVVASLPTNPSCNVTANIPILSPVDIYYIPHSVLVSLQFSKQSFSVHLVLLLCWSLTIELYVNI